MNRNSSNCRNQLIILLKFENVNNKFIMSVTLLFHKKCLRI